MICPRCGRWHPAEEDLACSWCGTRLRGLTVEARPSRVPLDGYPPPSILLVRNTSTTPVEVKACRTTAPWLLFPKLDGLVPFRLEPGEARQLPLQVNPFVAGEGGSARAILETTDGEASARVELVTPPELQITTGTYELFLDNRELEQNFVRIEVRRGATRLVSASAEPSAWVHVSLATDLDYPVPLDAAQQDRCYLRLEFDESALMQRVVQFPAEFEGSLRLEFEDADRVAPFRFRCWRPPEIWIWEESEPLKVFRAGLRGLLVLTLENGVPGRQELNASNAPLEISRIVFCDPQGAPIPWLTPADEEGAVLRIEGGQRRQVRYYVHTTAQAGHAGAEAGLYTVFARFWTNRPDPVKEIRLQIRVEPMPAYDGVLALDFGTSNTCCAVMDRLGEGYRLLPLDRPEHNPTPTVVPTVMQYLDRDRVRIGASVEARAADPAVAASTVRSLKRLLGRPDSISRIEVTAAENQTPIHLLPREAVGDYLTEIRKQAQEVVQARIERLIVTYPARFRLAQLRDLLEAVRQAFGDDCSIETVQEPVAAALDHIISGGMEKAGEFLLGVFDLGGGTTDLSLLRVTRSSEDGITRIRARLLGATGTWFGGEDVTQFILQAGFEKCRLQASQKLAAATVPWNVSAEEDPIRRYYARLNAFHLQQWAEKTKLLLVEHGDEHVHHLPFLPDIMPRLKLWLEHAGNVSAMEFQHNTLVPRCSELDEFVRREVGKMAGLLRELMQQCGESKLDVLVLSGKSSAMPAVQRTLRESFPHCELRLATNLKECVVAGACARERLAEAPDLLLEVEATTTTPTRIGLEDPARGRFWEWFPAGRPIPDEGLVQRRPCLIRTDRPLRLLENSSMDDRLWIEGRRNETVAELGRYRLVLSPRDGQPSKTFRAELEMRLLPSLDCRMRAYLPELDQWIELTNVEEWR